MLYTLKNAICAIHASRAVARSAVCVSIRTQPYPVDPPDPDQSGPYGLQGYWQLRSLQGTHGSIVRIQAWLQDKGCY
jgi:hypothetical protein